MMKWPWSKSEQKSGHSLIALSHISGAVWGRSDPAALIKDGYRGNPVAYRCIRLISEAAGSIVFKSDQDRVQALLSAPSPEQAGRALMEQVFTDLQITGNAWLEAVTPADETAPRALFGLPVTAVRLRQDAQGFVSGYAVQQAGGTRIIDRDGDGWLPVLHLKLYNPGDQPHGLSPLVAARKSLDIHNQAAGWAKALLDNAARPSGALMYGKDGARLSDEQFDRLKDQLTVDHTGTVNAGRPLLLEGGLDWRPWKWTLPRPGTQRRVRSLWLMACHRCCSASRETTHMPRIRRRIRPSGG